MLPTYPLTPITAKNIEELRRLAAKRKPALFDDVTTGESSTAPQSGILKSLLVDNPREAIKSLSEPSTLLSDAVHGKLGTSDMIDLAGSIDMGSGRIGAGLRGLLPKGKTYTAALDAGKDPRIVNMQKLNLSPEGEKQFRDLIGPEGTKRVVTHAEQQQAARHAEMYPDDLKGKMGDFQPHEHLAVSNIISENMDRIVGLSKKVTDHSLPQPERDLAQHEINRLSSDVTEFTRGIAKSRESKGRALNALKILANRNMEPSTWLAQAQRAKGNLPLSVDEQAAIHGFTKENDRLGLVQYINKMHTPHPLDQALGLWKAGLLTAARTHEVNMASNAAMSVAESAKDIPATVIDRFISLVRNERTPDGALRKTKAPSFRGLVTEPLKALKPGAIEAKKTLVNQVKGLPDEHALEKYDFRNTHYDNWFGSDFWNGYTRTVFGTLSAEDRIARAANVARSLEEQLKLNGPSLAKAQGIKPADYKPFIDGLRKKPPDNLMLDAIADAEVATFNNSNKLADAVSAFKNKLGPAGRGTTEFIAPFVRTPTNVVARLIDYSPLGLGRTVQMFKKALSIPEQKKLAENLGRSVTGSGLVVLGAMLAHEEKATGAAPSQMTGDSGDRAMWEEQGKLPNAVKIGGHWVQVANISPPGMLISLGAQMYNAAKGASTPAGAAAGAAFTVPRVALDQSFLKGVSGSLDAVNDPGRFGEKFAENTIGSVVPAGVAAIARGVDPVVRQPTGIGETLESRIPGLTGKVPPRIKPFGDVAMREGGFLGNVLNPLRTQAANKDPLLAQMEKLGLAPRIAGKTFKSNGVTVKRTPEEQRDFQRVYGFYQRKNLGTALNSPLLTTDEDKRKAGDKGQSVAYNWAKDDARQQSGKFVLVPKRKRH